MADSAASKLIGARIRTLRKQKLLSIAALAERADRLEAKYLSGVERGVRNPTVDVLARIAKGLDVDIATLFDIYELDEAAALRRRVRARLKSLTADQLRRVLRVIDATLT